MFGFLYLSLGICHPLRCHRNATLAVTLHKSQDKLSEYFKLKIIAGTTIALLNHFRHWPQGPSFTHFTHFEAQSFPLFPLRIYCVHLCSGSVSKNGKGAMWIDDNCNIYGIMASMTSNIFNMWPCLSVSITLLIPSACWSDSLWDSPACTTTGESCNKFSTYRLLMHQPLQPFI